MQPGRQSSSKHDWRFIAFDIFECTVNFLCQSRRFLLGLLAFFFTYP